MLNFPLDLSLPPTNPGHIDEVIAKLITEIDAFVVGRQYRTVVAQGLCDKFPYDELIATTEQSREIKNRINYHVNVLALPVHHKRAHYDLAVLVGAGYAFEYRRVNHDEYMVLLTTPAGVLRTHQILS